MAGYVKILMRFLIVTGAVWLLSACDYYVEKINKDWSLCAIDDPNDRRLCRNLGEGSYQSFMEPVMVAWGFDGAWITLKRCFEGKEEFYSVDATHNALYSEPNYIGPFGREEMGKVIADEPERWPEIDHRDRHLERRHCPSRE